MATHLLVSRCRFVDFTILSQPRLNDLLLTFLLYYVDLFTFFFLSLFIGVGSPTLQ